MFNGIAATIAATAALIGSLTYIGRKLDKLVGVIRVLIDLPAKNAELTQATAENSAAIADLTDKIRHLTQIVTNYGER